MSFKDLSKPLSPEDVELRVGSVFKGGYATLLTYKTARTDVARLDEAVGAENWTNEFFYNEKKILSCKIGIWNEKIGQFVYKEDVGTESSTEKEKGSHSDAFKRAGFKLGIGTELYKIKNIFVKLSSDEFYMEGSRAKATNKLKVALWKFEYKGDQVVITDNHGKVRFNQRYDFVDTEFTKQLEGGDYASDTPKCETIEKRMVKVGLVSKIETAKAKISKGGDWESFVALAELITKTDSSVKALDFVKVMEIQPSTAKVTLEGCKDPKALETMIKTFKEA